MPCDRLDHQRLTAIALVALALVACAPEQTQDPAYVAEIESWRAEREERLTEPYGWLSLIGLHPLTEGETRIGSGADADLLLPRGPEHWGVLRLDGTTATFEAAADWQVTVDGEAVSAVTLTAAGDADATRVEAAGIQFHLLERAERLHIRIRDREAASRRNFVGLSWFEVDPSWAIEGAFEPNPPGTTLRVADVTGEIAERPNPGAVAFRRGGEVQRLQAVESSSGRLWFIFADGTSGRETYGLGRFLYADPPENGRVLLDFNQAYNPPCAFNQHTTCPLPPPANRLDLRIEAGELAYTGPVGLRPDSIVRDAG